MSDYRKKLIEVALPLEAINRESAREKSIRHGHPSTLHLWWARRPLAACRAVLFASLVDDPSANPEQFPTEDDQATERQRLFGIIEDLVKWENSSDEAVLEAAHAEIMRSTNGNPPPVRDPFCGGGSIPLEAQRLGLEARGSDLNPVAVLITKAMIEIPPRFAGLPPVNPSAHAKLGHVGWHGAEGLADDVRYYGRWMRDEAERRIGSLYPSAALPEDQGGGEASVIAWLWARTVKCPNPACGAQMPLVRSFELSTKKGQRSWVEPIVSPGSKTVSFELRAGSGIAPDGTVTRQGARCIVCGSTVPFEHIRSEGRAGRMGAELLAIVAEGTRGRVYLEPSPTHARCAREAEPAWVPQSELPDQALGFRVQLYGMTRHRDLFTDRQLVALATFSDLVVEARWQVLRDAQANGVLDELITDSGEVGSGSSTGPEEYARAVSTYLALAVDKGANLWSSLCSWMSDRGAMRETFARQALSMVWDFAEANPFSQSGGSFSMFVERVADVVAALPAAGAGSCEQLDATCQVGGGDPPLTSTDPPYYDNIGYADLSDFFFVWLRRSLGDIYPDLFSTLLTPKKQELIASPFRFDGSKKRAKAFFEDGLERFFQSLRTAAQDAWPLTLYYAFKQAESDGDASSHNVASTGWETMLTGLLRAGFCVTGTWPLRTEGAGRMRSQASNALASSVVLVCRPRAQSAPLATRQDFIATLRAELPGALTKLQHGNIAPVDLAQASIGPGMAVFSRYSRVMEADGSQMSVRAALSLINQALDEILAEQEGEFDADTRWAIGWFEQMGLQAGEFGVAETLCKAKNCSVPGLVEAGILEAKAGRVRLLSRDELDQDWDPSTDKRITVWEMTQHLIRRLDKGEAVTAALSRQLGSYAEVARDLAYRLYLICERKKWTQEALAYNALVVAWPQIQRLAAAEPPAAGSSQTSFEV